MPDQEKNTISDSSSSSVQPAGIESSTLPPAVAHPTRRSHKRWIIVGAALACLVVGAVLWHYVAGFETTDDAQVDVHLYPVSARISG